MEAVQITEGTFDKLQNPCLKPVQSLSSVRLLLLQLQCVLRRGTSPTPHLLSKQAKCAVTWQQGLGDARSGAHASEAFRSVYKEQHPNTFGLGFSKKHFTDVS